MSSTSSSSSSSANDKKKLATRNFFFLALNNPVSYGGSTISGYCIVLVTHEIPAKSVWVQFEGREYTSWLEGVKQDKHMSAMRKIFTHRQQLWANSEELLKPGTHTYPFEFKLPENLPSSFEDSGNAVGMIGTLVLPTQGFMPKSFGKDKSFIRYVVNAFVDKKAMQPIEDSAEVDSDDDDDADTDKSDKRAPADKADNTILMSTWQAFRVWQAFHTDNDEPVEATASKTFMFGKKPVELTATLPFGGNFFVGTGLFVRLTVNNQGTKAVDGARLSLSDELTLIGDNDARLSRSTSLTTGVVPNSVVAPGALWVRDAVLPLPAQTGPTITSPNSALIQHKYTLKIDLSGGLVSSFSLSIPVTIWGGAPALAGVVVKPLKELKSAKPEEKAAPPKENEENEESKTDEKAEEEEDKKDEKDEKDDKAEENDKKEEEMEDVDL